MQITEKIILCQYHYKNVEPFSFLVLFLEALIGSIEYLKYKVLTCIKKKKKKKKKKIYIYIYIYMHPVFHKGSTGTALCDFFLSFFYVFLQNRI